MAKLFLGLAIAIMLATAVLGFLAKGNIDKLQFGVKEAKSNLARADAAASKAKSDLEKSREELTAAASKADAAAAEAAAATKAKNDAATELSEKTTLLETKTAQLAALEKRLNDMPSNGPTGEDVGVRIQQMQNDLAKLTTDNAEKTAMVDELTRRTQEKETQLAAAQSEVKRYQANVTRSGLSGKILAVDPAWNFVVLSVGDRQGAMVGGVMLVTRGGEPIARARITSVEPATSIADVLPGSLRKGVTVQPGDGVVFEGTRTPRANTLAAPAPAAAPGTPALPAQ
jgi:flagellar biosynthesis chaperone FliJ